MTAEHRRLLELAAAARDAENSGLWKTDPDLACEAHGGACDAFWAEAYRQIDQLNGSSGEIVAPIPQRDPAREAQKAIIAHIRKELPGLVAAALEGFEYDLPPAGVPVRRVGGGE